MANTADNPFKIGDKITYRIGTGAPYEIIGVYGDLCWIHRLGGEHTCVTVNASNLKPYVDPYVDPNVDPYVDPYVEKLTRILRNTATPFGPIGERVARAHTVYPGRNNCTCHVDGHLCVVVSDDNMVVTVLWDKKESR